MDIQENLYCVFDRLSGTFHHFTVASNDGLAVRNILLTLTCPLKDNVCLKLGKFEKKFQSDAHEVSLYDCVFTSFDDFQEVSWDSYRFPENVAEALAPLGVSADEAKAIAHAKVGESDALKHSRVPNGIITEVFRKMKKGE